MAQAVITTVTDDIDGSEDANTYVFGFDGQWYEIDLAEKNVVKFQKFLDTFVPNAREVELVPKPKRGRPKGSKVASEKTPSGSGRTKEEIAAARIWARAQGLGVSDRGRVSKDIWAAYDAAQGVAA